MRRAPVAGPWGRGGDLWGLNGKGSDVRGTAEALCGPGGDRMCRGEGLTARRRARHSFVTWMSLRSRVTYLWPLHFEAISMVTLVPSGPRSALAQPSMLSG
jgi:hypothetical protein